jgi:hypothetical protein
MEKYVIFGPIIIFFGFFGLLVLGLFLLVFKLVFKAKGEAWIGTVIDKGHSQKRKDDTKRMEHFYFYKVKLENGEEHNIACSAKMYEEITIGDRMKKEKGSLWAKKIS